MRKINSKFQTKFISEDGGKLINRDYFAFVELDKFSCYVLADGIDEDKEQLSAKIAVTNVIRSFTENPTLNKRKLKSYVRKAHKELRNFDSGMSLRASIVIVVTNYVKFRYVMCGNSRFCLLRNGVIHTKTKDQSFTRNLVDAEKIELDKASRHEERNNLYSYLGQEEGLKIEVSKLTKFLEGDIFLQLSRGVWESCDDGELIDAAVEAKEPQEIIDNVEELILSKQSEEIDNYTLAVTFVDKVYKKPIKKWTAKKILLIVLPILLIVIVIGVVLFIKDRNKKNNIRSMNDYIDSAKEYAQIDHYSRALEDYKEALKFAKKLKKDKVKNEIVDYTKLFDQIILADEKLDSKDYQSAVDAYLKADDMTKETGSIGRDYIDSQLDKAKDYIDVLDLLAEGDKHLDNNNPKAARESYKKAKELANELFYQEGKQSAVDSIDKIDEKAADEKAEAKAAAEKKAAKKEEAEEKKKQEEKEKEAEEEKKLSEQLNALEIEKKANSAYDSRNFEDAKMYYLTAQEIYGKLELNDKVNTIEKKIQLTEKKSSDMEKNISKAEQYISDADSLLLKKKYSEARILYLLARDIYDKAGFTADSDKIADKIAAIDKAEEIK